MKVLFGYDAAVADWVAARIAHVGRGENFGPCAAIGVIDAAGRLLGGVVYHNWQESTGNIELSFAADTPRWLTRRIIGELLRYPFWQLGCIRVTGVTPRKATSARRFLDKFGFKREGLVRKGFGNDDAVISGLLRTEWEASKWSRPRPTRFEAHERAHGEEGAKGSAAA